MGLSVSRDGTTILYNKVVNHGADLMLIEKLPVKGLRSIQPPR
jgi:hypothetical protein